MESDPRPSEERPRVYHSQQPQHAAVPREARGFMTCLCYLLWGLLLMRWCCPGSGVSPIHGSCDAHMARACVSVKHMHACTSGLWHQWVHRTPCMKQAGAHESESRRERQQKVQVVVVVCALSRPSGLEAMCVCCGACVWVDVACSAGGRCCGRWEVARMRAAGGTGETKHPETCCASVQGVISGVGVCGTENLHMWLTLGLWSRLSGVVNLKCESPIRMWLVHYLHLHLHVYTQYIICSTERATEAWHCQGRQDRNDNQNNHNQPERPLTGVSSTTTAAVPNMV